jgi:hypothetical protein
VLNCLKYFNIDTSNIAIKKFDIKTMLEFMKSYNITIFENTFLNKRFHIQPHELNDFIKNNDNSEYGTYKKYFVGDKKIFGVELLKPEYKLTDTYEYLDKIKFIEEQNYNNNLPKYHKVIVFDRDSLHVAPFDGFNKLILEPLSGLIYSLNENKNQLKLVTHLCDMKTKQIRNGYLNTQS